MGLHDTEHTESDSTAGSLVLIHAEFIWNERSYLSISHPTLWTNDSHVKVSLVRQRLLSSSWGRVRTAGAESQEFTSAGLHRALLCPVASMHLCPSALATPFCLGVTTVLWWVWEAECGWEAKVGGIVGVRRGKREFQKLLEAKTLNFLLSQNCSLISRWCNDTSASASLFRVKHCEEEESISWNQITCCVRFLWKISRIHYLLNKVMRSWLE